MGLCFYHLATQADPKALVQREGGEDGETQNLFEDAIREYGKAIEKNESCSIFYFNRGNVHLNMKDFQKAHEDFDRAISIDQMNPKFWHAKGLTNQTHAESLTAISDKQEQHRLILDAIDMFDHSQECSESFYSAIFHQGLMYRRIGQYHDALRQFSKVQEKLPGDKSVYYGRGLVY